MADRFERVRTGLEAAIVALGRSMDASDPCSVSDGLDITMHTDHVAKLQQVLTARAQEKACIAIERLAEALRWELKGSGPDR